MLLYFGEAARLVLLFFDGAARLVLLFFDGAARLLLGCMCRMCRFKNPFDLNHLPHESHLLLILPDFVFFPFSDDIVGRALKTH